MWKDWEQQAREATEKGKREIEEQKRKRDAIIQPLANTFITKGKDVMLEQFNALIKDKKLKTFEVIIITGNLRNLLINNGYSI